MERIQGESAIADAGLITLKIHETPIKTQGNELIVSEQLHAQAEVAFRALVIVDYKNTRGTCIDERKRESLRNGKPCEPRPSVPGGPDIYGLAIGELTGAFNEENTAEESLADARQRLNLAGFLSGGHDKCAANAKFTAWMQLIADDGETYKPYAQMQLGEEYEEDAANIVINYAKKVVSSGKYAHWKEENLAKVYGDEAGDAIEELIDVPHEGKTLVRNYVDYTTVDQSNVYDNSVVGKGSFVNDECYADDIEHVFSSDPNAVHEKMVAEHAREFILAALANAVPNEELYQIELRSDN